MMPNKRFIRPTILVGILLLFTTIFCLISFVNHCLFRTSALDLGMFNHAIYNFSHFSQNYFTLDIEGAEINNFACHFSPITIMFSPFLYLFGSYTLLIIQIAAILFGGLGVYKYSLQSKRHFIPLIILIHFFCTWGIYSALSNDFHNNVIAAMFVPWLFYYYKKRQKIKFLIFFILILISKENMALWLIFILLGLILDRIITQQNFKFREYLRFSIPLLFISVLYFLIVFSIIMPYLLYEEGLGQIARYKDLGDSVPAIMKNIISQPKYVFSLLFENLTGNELYDGIKSELHFMVIISGGFALFFRPQFLIILIPIYAQKMLTTDFALWGINSQYSIEFSPILSICLVSFLGKIKSNKIAYSVAIITTILTILYTYKTIESRESLWYDKTNTAFYDKQHYDTELNLKEIYNQLEKIPDNAIVSTSSNLAPHLAFREKIYHFPIVKDADYLILFTSKRSTYPLSQEEFENKITSFLESNIFETQYYKNGLLILKRKI